FHAPAAADPRRLLPCPTRRSSDLGGTGPTSRPQRSTTLLLEHSRRRTAPVLGPQLPPRTAVSLRTLPALPAHPPPRALRPPPTLPLLQVRPPLPRPRLPRPRLLRPRSSPRAPHPLCGWRGSACAAPAAGRSATSIWSPSPATWW